MDAAFFQYSSLNSICENQSHTTGWPTSAGSIKGNVIHIVPGGKATYPPSLSTMYLNQQQARNGQIQHLNLNTRRSLPVGRLTYLGITSRLPVIRPESLAIVHGTVVWAHH